MPCIHHDQNIERVYPKMSERFSDQNDAKLNSVNYLDKTVLEENKDELKSPYDHMYATHNESGENSEEPNCQSAESEVKFWKEWLILHLDLIQQQSDEILSKEHTILFLQQENEMLKERISCMERGAPFQPDKFYTSSLDENLEMTQGPCDEDNKTCLELISENGDLDINFEAKSDTESQTENATLDSSVNSDSLKIENTESENFKDSELDPMKNVKMNIRKKRLSNSSAVSTELVKEERRPFRKFKKRRKRVIKDMQILTTTDPYISEASDTLLTVSDTTEVPISSDTLEVPRWRVKVYASCYTMEGTENLDDEVYYKRHSRLENDERRRKRWDVQRIREQRVIEKLKQRQERTGSGSRVEEPNELIHSLWPGGEDIKFLEISDQLPVSAFGCPVPKMPPSEFNLPWLTNPSILTTRKTNSKKATVRRKSSKR